MFHQSENIIITSKKKPDDTSSERPQNIFSRQRAATWSSPSLKDDSSNSNSPPGAPSVAVNLEKRKYRNLFSIRKSVNSGAPNLNSSTAATASPQPVSKSNPGTPRKQPQPQNQPQPQPQHLQRNSFLLDHRSSLNRSLSFYEPPEKEEEEEGIEVTVSSPNCVPGEGSVSSPVRVHGVTNKNLGYWLDSTSEADDANINQNQNQNLFQDASRLENADTIELSLIDYHNNNDTHNTLITNASNHDSPALTSPSSGTGLQDDNDKTLYTPTYTNIVAGSTGMLTHKDSDLDQNEEEKRSYDYDDEQPYVLKANNTLATANTHIYAEDPNTIPLEQSPSDRSTNANNFDDKYAKESPTINTDTKDDTTIGYVKGEGKSNLYAINTLTSTGKIVSDFYVSNSDHDSEIDHMQEWDSDSDVSTTKHWFHRTKYLCFLSLPKPSWSRISSAVVRHAPCFWCCATVEISSTDRVILTKLNKLCIICALYQILCGVAYTVVLLSQKIADRTSLLEGEGDAQIDLYKEALIPSLWIPSGSLLWIAAIGFIVFVTMISTARSIRRVNLQGALRYMWVLYWILPLQIICVLSFIDLHQATDVWIKHWWSTRSMAGFRKFFCAVDKQCQCAVPLKDVEDKDWCNSNCDGAEDCGDQRDFGIAKMTVFMGFAFTTSAIVGVILVALLMLALFLLQRIISAPIVKSSKESNIPLWLTFPTIFSFLGGVLFTISPQTISRGPEEMAAQLSPDAQKGLQIIHYIGYCYFVTGAFFLTSALLGWFIAATTVLDSRDKTRKMIAVYLFIGMMVLTMFAVVVVLVYSLIYSSSLVDLTFNDDERGRIACFHDLADSCSNCNTTNNNTIEANNGSRRCPEWDKSDVMTLVQTILKQSAAFATIFVIYAFTALRFGFTLKTLVSRYEVDYV